VPSADSQCAAEICQGGHISSHLSVGLIWFDSGYGISVCRKDMAEYSRNLCMVGPGQVTTNGCNRDGLCVCAPVRHVNSGYLFNMVYEYFIVVCDCFTLKRLPYFINVVT